MLSHTFIHYGEKGIEMEIKKGEENNHYYMLQQLSPWRDSQKTQRLSTEDKIYQQRFIDYILINEFLFCKYIL